MGTGIYFSFTVLQGENVLAVGGESGSREIHADVSQNSACETIFLPDTNVFDIFLFNIHLIIPFINFS